MEKIVIDQNGHWLGKQYENLMERACLDELYRLISLKEIMVLLGVRRCGKTSIFRLLINYLMQDNDPKSIFYVNLDDPYFDAASVDAKYLYKIIENAERFSGTKVVYLFLDEIQNVPGWEKFIKSVYDSHKFKKIFITGSNSSLLQGQYATLLSGRYVDMMIHPLSIQEALAYHKLDSPIQLAKERSTLLSILDSMMMYGSFPEVFLQTDPFLKRKILVSYYETILLKDCIAQNNIRNSRLVRELAHYMLSNITCDYSYHSLAQALGSNEHTLKDYMLALKNGFMFDEVKNFSYSLKQQSKGRRKAYCVDNGFISSIGFNFSQNLGELFENLVYTELKKLGFDEIYLLSEDKGCDFIVKRGNQFIPIQACYELNDKNRRRELKGLKYAMEKTGARKALVVTLDQDEALDQEGILTIPIVKQIGSILDM